MTEIDSLEASGGGANMGPAIGSTLWRLVETYHSVVYFAPERTQHYSALGLKGGWMGYFASRSAALGAVPVSVVTACFYNFNHTMVARALPDAWRYTTPDEAIRARCAVFDDAVHRLVGTVLSTPAVDEAARICVEAVQQCCPSGRPLFAAHASLSLPDEPHLRLFWATTALREFRGDGHNAALASAGVDGCEANVLMSALGLVPPEQSRYRGWSEEDWRQATERLIVRGWLNDDGTITTAGRSGRAEIERLTDALAREPWQRIGEEAALALGELLTPIASRIVTGGGVPYPNGMGVPPVPELSAVQ